MTNAFSAFRSLIIYSICLPLAIIVGYFLATTPTDVYSFMTIAVLLALMTIPLFLRWHYPWMLLCWNMSAVVFFLPGKPAVGAVLLMISFTISVLQYILNRRMKFIPTPMVTKPLLFIMLVVLVTARFTGGIGLNALGGGGENVGGKRYIFLILGIVGFFALTAVKIPENRRKLYMVLFFGGALTQAIANLAYYVSPSLSFIFVIFPTDASGIGALADNSVVSSGSTSSITRLGGLSSSCISIIYMMLAFYGIRGFLDLRKLWRPVVMLALMIGTMFGGFRSQIITVGIVMALMFYMEGLTRTRALPAFILIFILMVAIAIPSVQKMPLVMQRSLAFLPIDIAPEAADNAAGSTEWRLKMWAEVLPEIPQYLILGKGLSINAHDLDMERDRLTKGEDQFAGAMLAGDYHNGPLSLIIPFGLFGTFGFIWFLVAGGKVLYRNYKFGDPDLELFNRFFLAQYIMKVFAYFVIFGSFYGDLGAFCGIVGLSIALNHGIAKPAEEPVPRPVFAKFRLANANAVR